MDAVLFSLKYTHLNKLFMRKKKWCIGILWSISIPLAVLISWAALFTLRTFCVIPIGISICSLAVRCWVYHSRHIVLPDKAYRLLYILLNSTLSKHNFCKWGWEKKFRRRWYILVLVVLQIIFCTFFLSTKANLS